MLRLSSWNIEGVRFDAGIVDTEEERDACARLRYLTYAVDYGYVSPSSYPNGRETDAADAYATQLIGTQDGEPVGVVRLIPCEKGFLFDGHRFGAYPPFQFPERHPVTGVSVRLHQAGEFSRWVSRPRPLPSGTQVLVGNLMLEALLEATRLMGREYWISTLIERKHRELVRDGWPFVDLVPGVFRYGNGDCCVVWLDVDERAYTCRRVRPSR